MDLIKITAKEFKHTLYADYQQLFPDEERKNYRLLKKSYKQGIAHFFQIIEQNELVGFFIVNTIPNSPYAILDYFAILPKFQSKGYGSSALLKLKEEYSDLNGIWIEVEKIETGKDEQDKEIRKRRIQFYQKNRFCSYAI